MPYFKMIYDSIYELFTYNNGIITSNREGTFGGVYMCHNLPNLLAHYKTNISLFVITLFFWGGGVSPLAKVGHSGLVHVPISRIWLCVKIS